MRTQISILTSLLLILGFGSVKGQNLYVFSVIETSGQNRPDRKADAEQLRSFVTDVARWGNYTLHWYDFGEYSAFRPDVVRSTVDSFTPQSPEVDVVWFYYAGKGFSDGPKAWPTLRLNGGDLPVRDLLATLRPHSVRTLLVTTDCSNRPGTPALLPAINQQHAPPPTKTQAIRPTIIPGSESNFQGSAIARKYKALFRPKNIRQVIVMASASRGQQPYRHLQRGSVWLQALIQTIMEPVHPAQPGSSSWKQIGEKVARVTQNQTNYRQLPLINRQTITCCETESTN